MITTLIAWSVYFKSFYVETKYGFSIEVIPYFVVGYLVWFLICSIYLIIVAKKTANIMAVNLIALVPIIGITVAFILFADACYSLGSTGLSPSLTASTRTPIFLIALALIDYVLISECKNTISESQK
ncbi:MAG: hypothetical protein JNJ77_09660 [Planctomycetia bacterium]|nr:hypothetical protein [Planctomycetia bacterium]